MSSIPVSRRCLLVTIFGSKLESRSLGEHCLRPVAITGIAAITVRGVVLAVAEMVIQLALQGALDHHLGQPAEQAAR